MTYGTYCQRVRAYRNWNHFGLPRAAWVAMSDRQRAVVVLVFVTCWIIFWTSFAFAQTPVGTPTPKPVPMGWYIQLQPVAGGPTCLVGDFPWYAGAADWDGSCLYRHPFACHLTGNPADCKITGNGYCYPQFEADGKTPLPYPPSHQIPSSGPIRLPLAGNPHQRGWYSIYYDNATGACTVFPKAQAATYSALVKAGKGVIPFYADKQCPGHPWLYIGSGFNQPDWVCG